MEPLLQFFKKIIKDYTMNSYSNQWLSLDEINEFLATKPIKTKP